MQWINVYIFYINVTCSMSEWANAVHLQYTPALIYKRFECVKMCSNRYHTQTNVEECAKYWEEQAFLWFTKPVAVFVSLFARLRGRMPFVLRIVGLQKVIFCELFDLRVSFWCHIKLFNKWPSPVLFADFFHKPFFSSSYTIYWHFLFSPWCSSFSFV